MKAHETILAENMIKGLNDNKVEFLDMVDPPLYEAWTREAKELHYNSYCM